MNSLAPSSSAATQQPPQHLGDAQSSIDQTLSRLSAYRNVRGVMVLARRMAAAPTETKTKTQSESESEANEPNGVAGSGGSGVGGMAGIVQSTGSVFEGEGGRRYALAVEGIVGAVTGGIETCDAGDELKLMRIRTKRHELIITPHERYVLVVLQDPGA